MAATQVKPNRRGVRSRELVLDAAERVMAEDGFEATTLARVVDEAGIPMSSVYHYFGSKEGILLAVMERGAERFHVDVPDVGRRRGSQTEHLSTLFDAVAYGLERHPDFLRILVVMAAQPFNAGKGEVHEVVNRVRELALVRLRAQMQLVFGAAVRGAAADHLARFALAAIEGAFVAHQADPKVKLDGLLEHLPAALVAIRRQLR